MLSGELLAQAKQVAQGAAQKAEEYSGVIGSIQSLIVQYFGQNGLYAAYILLASMILFVASKLARITFSTLKFLIIPSVALAFIGSLFVPYSFPALLPVTVTICSLFLLFKG
jgi:hypothetical protein